MGEIEFFFFIVLPDLLIYAGSLILDMKNKKRTVINVMRERESKLILSEFSDARNFNTLGVSYNRISSESHYYHY